MPDPYPTEHPVVRHVMYVSVRSFPKDLAERLEPNARRAGGDLAKRVYREVQSSLQDEDVAADGIFHLKHSGITTLARSVKDIGDNKLEVVLAWAGPAPRCSTKQTWSYAACYGVPLAVRSEVRAESGALVPLRSRCGRRPFCDEPIPTPSGRGHESRRFLASGRGPRGLTNVGLR